METNLFSTWKIKNTEIKNRIVMAPMAQYSSINGEVNDWHYIHYVSRAVGQVGLIIVEATVVSEGNSMIGGDLAIYDDRFIPGLKKIVDSCHQYGSKIILQLAHAGRKCGIDTDVFLAPSAVAFNASSKVPKEMSIEEIKKIVNDFKQAALRALKAGFDGIEIHAAHGYLINQFLSPLSNFRQDEYGKDRAKFLREILEEVKVALPKNFLIFLRISATDYVEEGNKIEDFIRMLNPIKIFFDVLNVSTGGVIETPIKVYPGYQVEPARILREKLQIPCIGGGLISEPMMANRLIRSDVLDGVYLARELLKNPYWALEASLKLKIDIDIPVQYERVKFLYK